MGIKGLLPLLKSIHRPVHLRDFKGKTLAVDVYCWLHKGAFGCAMDLALGRPTRKYIDFCMQRVRLMKHFGIRPYLVFDGCLLPMKGGTEDERYRKRQENFEQGQACLAAGNRSKAMEYFQISVDVTAEMALELIKELRKENIDYLVAMYEADAQMAYLENAGLVDGVITEDSDLLVFGCQSVIYKLDKDGSGIEIRTSELAACTELNFRGWTINEFRQMCILSGCDYLPSIPGLGLKRAYKFLRQYKSPDKVVRALRLDKSLIPKDYVKQFQFAELTFLHQRVFDPVQKQMTTLTPLPDSILNDEEFETISKHIGPMLDAELAYSISIGEIDPIHRVRLINFSEVENQSQVQANATTTLKESESTVITKKSLKIKSSSDCSAAHLSQLAYEYHPNVFKSSRESAIKSDVPPKIQKTSTTLARNVNKPDPDQKSILSFTQNKKLLDHESKYQVAHAESSAAVESRGTAIKSTAAIPFKRRVEARKTSSSIKISHYFAQYDTNHLKKVNNYAPKRGRVDEYPADLQECEDNDQQAPMSALPDLTVFAYQHESQDFEKTQHTVEHFVTQFVSPVRTKHVSPIQEKPRANPFVKPLKRRSGLAPPPPSLAKFLNNVKFASTDQIIQQQSMMLQQFRYNNTSA